VRGGRFKLINTRFFNNVCDDVGPDVGGAAVRVFDQFDGQPVYVVNSTFGGEPELGNRCSNGGGLSSIGVSYTVINSLFSYNEAIGNGANPAQEGTPGGGSGGAIYNDGNTFTLTLCGTKIEHNTANEGGGAIFFVSNAVRQPERRVRDRGISGHLRARGVRVPASERVDAGGRLRVAAHAHSAVAVTSSKHSPGSYAGSPIPISSPRMVGVHCSAFSDHAISPSSSSCVSVAARSSGSSSLIASKKTSLEGMSDPLSSTIRRSREGARERVDSFMGVGSSSTGRVSNF
jgi:hypothetical protein